MKPLGNTERKIILAAELYQRRRGQAPTWTELRKIVGADRNKVHFVVTGLRKKGLVDFQDDVPRSLRVLPHAVGRAMQRP